jgi:hypothetical protein
MLVTKIQIQQTANLVAYAHNFEEVVSKARKHYAKPFFSGVVILANWHRNIEIKLSFRMFCLHSDLRREDLYMRPPCI